jgi:hypothetical protein
MTLDIKYLCKDVSGLFEADSARRNCRFVSMAREASTEAGPSTRRVTTEWAAGAIEQHVVRTQEGNLRRIQYQTLTPPAVQWLRLRPQFSWWQDNGYGFGVVALGLIVLRMFVRFLWVGFRFMNPD